MAARPGGGCARAVSLRLIPISIQDAKIYIERHHRHHRAPISGLFAVAVGLDDQDSVNGVAIVGRPLSRMLSDGWTCEVTRVATDGTPNACSKLYGACWRAARAIGYRRLITYTLQTEPGTSLTAAGFRVVGSVKGRSWSCASRPRVDHQPRQNKFRWEMSV